VKNKYVQFHQGDHIKYVELISVVIRLNNEDLHLKQKMWTIKINLSISRYY